MHTLDSTPMTPATLTGNTTRSKTRNISIKALKDLAPVFGPQWRKMWDHIKEITGTRQRSPKSVGLFVDPRPVYLDDGECAKRFAWDMSTGEITESLHVSSGEWACHGGSNNDQAVSELPENTVIITVIWQEYYRSMSLDVQAHPTMLQAALQA